MRDSAISCLLHYALRCGLVESWEKNWAVNTILDVLHLDGWTEPAPPREIPPLAEILETLLDDVCQRGLLPENTTTYRDLWDTELMGRLTPRPAQVIERFWSLYRESPQKATDWYYQFSQDTNYIRRDRILRDVKWKTHTPYGTLEITINLSKPEKDPKAIAAARDLPASGYPRCALCAENEGYAGRLNHPARQNHRIIPLNICGAPWYLQYSPYVYYPEHCICLSAAHTPMKIDCACFAELLDFVRQFPHYFVGSNADLPIVGGSILSHAHFQGGHHRFPMEAAPVETPFSFSGFPEVSAGIVRWPLSVIRLQSEDSERLVSLADRILSVWRAYTDSSVGIYARTGDTPHNTITPIARRRGELFELDLVLRNNRTSEDFPLGIFHPHPELHHMKKENIGLIEVMGLAVLPARLKEELAAVADALCRGTDLRENALTSSHADWAEMLRSRYAITTENVQEILHRETGLVFAQVLEHCGVFKRDGVGNAAFMRFLESVKT